MKIRFCFTHVQQPNETQFPTRGTMAGGVGAVPPLKNKFNLPPAPHNSREFPEQGMLQAESVVLAPPFLMKLSQSVGSNEKIWVVNVREAGKFGEFVNVKRSWGEGRILNSINKDEVNHTDGLE